MKTVSSLVFCIFTLFAVAFSPARAADSPAIPPTNEALATRLEAISAIEHTEANAQYYFAGRQYGYTLAVINLRMYPQLSAEDVANRLTSQANIFQYYARLFRDSNRAYFYFSGLQAAMTESAYLLTVAPELRLPQPPPTSSQSQSDPSYPSHPSQTPSQPLLTPHPSQILSSH